MPCTVWHIAQLCVRKICSPRVWSSFDGGGAILALMREPGRVFVGCLGDHEERHQRMFVTAELGALAAVLARVVRAKTDPSAVRPGIRSFLPCRFGTRTSESHPDDLSVTSTGWPTGMCISLAVMNTF